MQECILWKKFVYGFKNVFNFTSTNFLQPPNEITQQCHRSCFLGIMENNMLRLVTFKKLTRWFPTD